MDIFESPRNFLDQYAVLIQGEELDIHALLDGRDVFGLGYESDRVAADRPRVPQLDDVVMIQEQDEQYGEHADEEADGEIRHGVACHPR